MNYSLAIISVLAVFSAWVDGHDYLAAWADLLPPLVIRILQGAHFVLILAVVALAVINIFGKKAGLSRSERKAGKK
jgi:hypothetical protein